MKKAAILFLLYAYSSKNLIVAQELIDFYNTPPSKPLADFVYSAQTGPTYYYWFYQGIVYNGEYQIDLSNIPWGNQSRVSPGIDINNFLISYEIEAVSFPFSLDCAFPNSTYPDGNCGYGNTRELIMPEDNYYNSNSNSWDYPLTSQISTNKLSRYVLQTGTRPDINSWMSSPNSLVSSTFEGGGVGNDRNALPHTILKHTIRLHCGTSLTGSPIINSFSFLLDHTRGKMREYPFTSSNTPGGIATHDIVIKPELWMLNSDYSKTENCEAYSIPSNIINQCSAVWGSILGGTLDYQPYNEIDDNDCTVLSYVPVNNPANSFTVDAYTADRLPIAPFTFILSTFPRISYGEALAGYSNDGTNLNSKVTPGQEMVHKYFIDKYIDLSRINPIEKVIYNPSEVYITCPASENLRFSSGWTFKTIRATFPFDYYVEAANNDPSNGGPFTDLRKVPVETDLFMDYHISSNAYPNGSTDHKYSSIYHLISGSKLTIEPCVKLFDCTFEINPGSEIVFENTPTNINKQRYQLLYTGGTVTERDEQWLFQNKTETRTILNYEAADFIKAGTSVDNNQPQGAYIVDANADVTFVASNQVVLKHGFRANAGSKFHAYISPITVPGCPQRMARPDHDYSQTEYVNSKNNNLFFLAPSLTTSRSFLNFKIQREGYYSIEVLNALGETQKKFFDNRFFRANTYKLDEDFTDLAPGVYICKLSGADEQYTTKFIKSN